MKKVLRFFAGMLAGFGYILLYFGGVGWLTLRLFQGGFSGGAARWLLIGLCLVGIVGFHMLSWLLRSRAGLHSLAFPLGAFVTADTAVALVPLLDLFNVERLIRWAGGKPGIVGAELDRVKATATVYLNGMFIIMASLIVLVLTWLIYMMFVAFGKVRKASLDRAVEEELARRAAAAAQQQESKQPPTHTDDGIQG